MSIESDVLAGLPEPDDSARKALREARAASSLSPGEYLAFLQALPAPRAGELRRRPLLAGEPFTLP